VVPSQLKYILEAALIILLALTTIKGCQFFSSADLYSDPTSGAVELSPSDNTSTVRHPGKILFIEHCARCHGINKNLVGPALEGIEERVPDRKLLVAWIRNNKEVLKSGDPYFTQLYKEYKGTPMDLFQQVKEEDIELILDYIRQAR
jgi:mono/diheme cytochrome c family protein